jgi:transaldolase
MPSKLDQLRAMTVVVADTGDLDAVRRLKPQDCTTNPTLILKAVETRPMPLSWTRPSPGPAARAAPARPWWPRPATGFRGLRGGARRIVPGRGLDGGGCGPLLRHRSHVARARDIIAAYAERGIGRERILIKIASTWEGIRAAEGAAARGHRLQPHAPVLAAQAAACAMRACSSISPFVGRILDWHVKAGGGPYTGETDPGVQSVRGIYSYYKTHGIGTVVMGASFRNAGEIEALAGCDRLTISPALLDELAKAEGDLPRRLAPETAGEAPARMHLDEKAFRFAMNEDAMATEKLAEGIRSFVKDLRGLRSLVARRLEEKEAA